MITAQDIKNVLGTQATTFAGIEYTTKVATAAKHKAVDIKKHTVANVQLFANIKAATSVFENAVKRTGNKIDQDPNKVEEFKVQENYFEHTDCYSVVNHKTKGTEYLYAIFNTAKSDYTINGKSATKAEVAEYLTPSAAEKLTQDNSIVHNKTYDVLHTIQVRTIALDNIQSIRAMGTELKA